MKKSPWHSERPGETVYHDNDKCEEGQKVPRMFWATGTDGRPLCKECARLDASRA
jgi:hypothetical protein